MKLGLYKHYSGKLYQVIGVAFHSENLEEMVVYKGLYNDPQFGNEPLWVRPKKMFTETVEINGFTQPRFSYQGDQCPI